MDDQFQRAQAKNILYNAAMMVTTQRGNQHGGAEDSFQMIANMWTEFVRSSTKHRAQAGDFTLVEAVKITPADVAKMMTLLKIARAVHGDPLNEDHYVDAAGYISLDGALSMGDKRVVPMTPKEPAEKMVDPLKVSPSSGKWDTDTLSPGQAAPIADKLGVNTTLVAARAVDAAEQK